MPSLVPIERHDIVKDLYNANYSCRVYRNYGLLSFRKEGWKERKKEERKTLFYTNNILIIT